VEINPGGMRFFEGVPIALLFCRKINFDATKINKTIFTVQFF